MMLIQKDLSGCGRVALGEMPHLTQKPWGEVRSSAPTTPGLDQPLVTLALLHPLKPAPPPRHLDPGDRCD